MTNYYAPILGMYNIRLIDISFYPKRDTKTLDPRTGETVRKLVKSRFTETNNVLTYVCDEDDGQQKLRQIKFQRWCERCLPEFDLQQINITLETEAGPHYRYAGILTHPDFPHEEEIDQYLIKNVQGIVAEKSEP